MNVIEVELTKLKPAPYNPRQISQHEFESLQRSLDEFGFVEPVVVNKTSGFIVGGHMRVNAARELGLKTAPVLYVELDDQKERALNVALNKISGEFDTDQLAELLTELDDESIMLTGFDESEIEKLQDGWVEHDDEGPSDKPKTTKYSLDELRGWVSRYPFNEHSDILNSFVEWLSENSKNTK